MCSNQRFNADDFSLIQRLFMIFYDFYCSFIYIYYWCFYEGDNNENEKKFYLLT